jgi:hypothetical protein
MNRSEVDAVGLDGWTINVKVQRERAALGKTGVEKRSHGQWVTRKQQPI